MPPTAPTAAPRPAGAPDLAKLDGLKLGNYRLERLLGRGRMGVVYLAKDEALLRTTAVKVLAWSAAEARGQDPVQWFLAEARLVARISDPRVVQIYGAARQGDLCYLAMEYVAGTSAEALVAGGRRMAPQAATDVLLQAATALHAAHRAGVVHRDVKPANLLVGSGGVTKLGDFGMAVGGPGAGPGGVHARVGTPFYTAPEVWRGEGASVASDVYALGATYFHLLTGRPPFDGPDVPAVERAHLGAPPPDPRALVPGLPASAAALVSRALAKDPGARQPSAQVLVWEARRVLQDLAATDHASAPLLPRRSMTPVPLRRPPPEPAVLPAATGPLAEVMGFTRRPFAEVEPAAWPYEGEPHASVHRRVLGALGEPGNILTLVTGAPGSGRSALCRRVAAELAPERLVLYLDLRADREGRSVVQRLCRAAGMPDDGPDDAEGLLGRLADERQMGRPTPLVVLDGLRPHDLPPGLAPLVGGAVWSRTFQVLLSGDADLADGLARAGVDLGPEPPAAVAIPPLDRHQVGFYVRNWLRAALPQAAAPVIVTPDALLLLARRSGGVVGRVNVIAENMLLLAAAERRRTLTTWHAWTASDRERWAGRPLANLPQRRGPWPPVEVVAVLDACRRAAGLPPWPRAAGR